MGVEVQWLLQVVQMFVVGSYKRARWSLSTEIVWVGLMNLGRTWGVHMMEDGRRGRLERLAEVFARLMQASCYTGESEVQTTVVGLCW